MKLQAVDVQQALAKLLNHFPESGHNSTTLARLAFDWFDLLTEEGVTRLQFSAGIRHAVKTCRFFPKLADVLEGVSSYRANPNQSQRSTVPQIEAHTATADNMTAEEVERNKERIQLITKALAGKLSWDAAEKSVAHISHITEFSVKNAEGKTLEGQP